MNKLLLLTVVCLLIEYSGYAQKPEKIVFNDNKKEVIYITFGENNPLSFNKIKNEKDAEKTIPTKDNSINIYFNWLNPLKYRITWKDTTMVDDRDKVISDFLSLLVGQFGKPVSDLNTPPPNLEKSFGATDSSEITGITFSDNSLNLYLIHLRGNEKYLIDTTGEIFHLNELSGLLKQLDDLDSYDYTGTATKVYSTLFNYKTINDYVNDSANQNQVVRDIEVNFKSIEKYRSDISEKLKSRKINDALLDSYIKAVVSGYLDKTLTNLNTNKKIITKLKPVMLIMENSTKGIPSTDPNKYKEHFKIKIAEFENGQKLESALIITEYEFDKENLDVTKKAEIINQPFTFQKYDIFDIYASTGIFYSNTTLKGFGLSNADSNFIITEDDISGNNGVYALFLNFDLRVVSRYISPLLQIGIDPTKKRPFLLFGGGLSFPFIKKSRLAMTGGLIMTWDQSLQTLSVGQSVKSTTDLENDIKYKFDPQPKGWYFGIQYNF